MKDYAIFKVKEGKLNHWKEWCSLLMSTHYSEALETLEYENSNREYYTLFTINNENFVMGASEFFDTPKLADMTVPLNQEHKRIFKDCLEFVSKGEQLCDLEIEELPEKPKTGF